MSDVFILNFGLDDRQYRNIIERLDHMTAQNDTITAALADAEASIAALQASEAALVTLTNAIFAELQNAANTDGLTAAEADAIVSRITALKQTADTLKTTDDTTVATDTPAPAPAPAPAP